MAPTRRFLAGLGAGLPLAVLPALLGPGWLAAWSAYLALLAVAVLFDALSIPSPRRLERTLTAPEQVVVGGDVVLRLGLAGRAWRSGARIEALLELSPELRAPSPQAGRLEPGGDLAFTFASAALRRGTGRVERLWMRWRGPLGLVERVVEERREERVAVTPDLRLARHSALRDLARHDAEAGTRRTVWAGEGSEFDAMREHMPGMDLRAISWRQSARHRRLVAHEFRAERNHQVIVAFDTGRLMRDPVAGMPRLDHAIHAGLRLAHVALRLGDRVGMYAFDERGRGFVPPRAGVRSGRVLERFTADLAYGTGETNYTLGLADLSARLTRRSLVVLLTEFVDSITAELMMDSTALLARRHLVAFVALGDPGTDTALRTRPTSLDQVYEGVVAADLLRDRRLVLRRLERRGLLVVDAPPSAVGEPLLARYLRVRRRELVG
jgi:uncharacterized protein (DUF58 family)